MLRPTPQHEHLARLCYFLLGCGFLTGWNAFLTATDFFNAAFPVSTNMLHECESSANVVPK